MTEEAGGERADDVIADWSLTGSSDGEPTESSGTESEDAVPDGFDTDVNGSETESADPTPAESDTDANANDGDDEVEPVEVLVQLAEDGEIDPWDIDIVSVTDAFLAELDETDLRTSGRALFYASVLLRMKSDAMLGEDDTDDEPEPEPWEQFGGEDRTDPEFDPVDALEAEMDRRLERKSARGTPETLDELVRELRDAERDSWWKRSREYDTTDSPTDAGPREVAYHGADDPRQPGEPEASDATATTHEEDIETLIDRVHTRLRREYEGGRAEVLFREVRDAGNSPIRTYLAVLFLSHRGHVRLQQDELFGDLWIRDPAAPAAGDEAVAD